MNKLRSTTHNIANKGFSGMQRVVARSNIRVGGQETPQSLTVHTLDRWHSP